MKINKILVAIDGVGMTLSSGARAVAVYPAGKGQDKSFLLLADGKLANMKGARLAGVGAARYFSENGFEPAKPGNPQAERLADMIDVRDGTDLVEKHNQARAVELARELGGQTCTYVPFDENKPVVPVKIKPYRGIVSTSYDMVNAFAAGSVSVEYDRETSGSLMDANLSNGWLVAPGGSPEQMPRNTEYGGPVERAVFTICNSGMGSLLGHQNLEMDENAPVDTPFARGVMTVALTNGDRLVVGIDACDELVVQYVRDNAVLYSRSGFQGNGNNALRFGEVVGAIAAVIVRVGEMDAVPVKGARAKKAA